MSAIAVVVGSASLDTNRAGGRTVDKLGGVVTYAGLTFARHGIPTVVVASIGRQDAGRLSVLRREGIEVIVQAGASSTRFVNETHEDRRTQSVEGVAEPIHLEDMLSTLAGDACLLLGALHPDDLAWPVLTLAAASKAQVAVDIQGYVRTIDERTVRSVASDRLVTVLDAAHFVKADVAELAVAREALGCDEAALVERHGIEELVVTEGSRGGRILRHGHDAVHYEAHLAEVVDATGAGDVFFAAYLQARIWHGRSVEEAARHAATIASAQVSGRYIQEAVLRTG